MKHRILLTLTSVLLTTMAAPTFAAKWENTVKLGLGTKLLESEWGVYDDQDSVGFMLDLKHNDIPFSIAIDAFGAGKEIKNDDVEIGVYSAELDLGARYTYEGLTSIKPYFGGGVALGYGNSDVKEGNKIIEVEDNAMGYWFGFGAQYEFSSSIVAGVDFRQSSFDVDLDGSEYDAGGKQVSFFVGYRW